MTQTGFPTSKFNATVMNPGCPEVIQGAIFDFDGTLVDSMPYWAVVGDNYLKNRGLRVTPGAQKAFREMTIEESAKYILKNFPIDEPLEDVVAELLKGVEYDYAHNVDLKPGVPEMLEAFYQAGVAMCIATASERSGVQLVLDRFDLNKYFVYTYCCSEVGISKTSPLVFEEALKGLGTPKETSFVVEDSLHAIRTAKAAGFPVLAMDEPASYPDKQAIMEISDAYMDSFANMDF